MFRRSSLDRVKAWHTSIQDAREVARDGVFTAGQFLMLLGRRTARRIYAPPCVYRRRHARVNRELAELHTALSAQPAPQPPDGYVWGFANGTEYDCFTCYNCDRCALAGDVSVAGSSKCEIFEAIHDAMDGTLPIAIADRMGMTANKLKLYWRCPEFVEAT